jgi:hypothetical protein
MCFIIIREDHQFRFVSTTRPKLHYPVCKKGEDIKNPPLYAPLCSTLNASRLYAIEAQPIAVHIQSISRSELLDCLRECNRKDEERLNAK